MLDLTAEALAKSPTLDEFGGKVSDSGEGRWTVQAAIDGLLVRIDLCQTFVNNLDQPLEATYIFPLPDRAAVTRFRL